MAFRVEYDSVNQILAIRFDGCVTDELLLSFYRVDAPKIIAATKFRASIVDFSEVTALEVAPATLRTLAWSEPIDQESSRPRVIVAPSDHIFGSARIFAAHGEDTRPSLHVVRTLRQAYAVLDVVHPQFAPSAQLGLA